MRNVESVSGVGVSEQVEEGVPAAPGDARQACVRRSPSTVSERSRRGLDDAQREGEATHRENKARACRRRPCPWLRAARLEGACRTAGSSGSRRAACDDVTERREGKSDERGRGCAGEVAEVGREEDEEEEGEGGQLELSASGSLLQYPHRSRLGSLALYARAAAAELDASSRPPASPALFPSRDDIERDAPGEGFPSRCWYRP